MKSTFVGFLFFLFDHLLIFGDWAAHLLCAPLGLLQVLAAAINVAVVIMLFYGAWGWVAKAPNLEATMALVLIWTFLVVTTASVVILALAAATYLFFKLPFWQ